MINNDNFAINFPFNATSFGNIGFSLAREIYNRGLNPCIFPIGNQIDLSTQKPDDKFNQWLQQNSEKALKTHNRKNPCIKLWHTNHDSMPSYSNEEVFITFIETDSITEHERNILSSKKTVFVTSNYLARIMEDYGIKAKYLQLGFDSYNFNLLDKKFYSDDRIVFSLLGKYEERRKNHKQTIQAWLKKFGLPPVGEKPKLFLQCALFNPFLVQNQNGQTVDHNPRLFQECLDGKQYCNISFFGWFGNNVLYNDILCKTL